MSKHRADIEPDAVPTEIAPAPEPTPADAPAPNVEPTEPSVVGSAIRVQNGLINTDDLRGFMQEQFAHFLHDIERRLGQTRELEHSMSGGGRRVFAEDINDLQHRIDGYTVTANSPSGGSIAWVGVHIMYAGVDYTIADGNTALRYTWFVKPGSYTPGTPVTLTSSNTKPTLATGDTFVFVNNAGVPQSVLDAGGQAGILQPGSVDSGAIIDGAVIGTKILDGAVIDTKIGTGAVTGVKILDGAVATAKIADDAINNAKIATGAVDTAELANNAVTNGKVADNAVTSTKIQDGAVGSSKVAAGGITPSKLNTLQHVMF